MRTRFLYLYEYPPVLTYDRYPFFQKRDELFRTRGSAEYMRDRLIWASGVKRGVNERDVFFQRCSRPRRPHEFEGGNASNSGMIGEPNVEKIILRPLLIMEERPLLIAATKLQYPVKTFTLSPSFSPDVQGSRHWTPYRSGSPSSDQKLKLRLEMRKIQSSEAIVLGSSQVNSSASGGSM